MDALTDAQYFRIDVLLSCHRAVWGMVTPELLSVCVVPVAPDVRSRFLYDGPVGDDERELVSEVETEVIADLWQHAVLEFVAVSLPVPARLELDAGEEWLYKRREAETI